MGRFDKALDEITNKQISNVNYTLFRITTTREFEQFVTNNIVKYPAFMSTSTNVEAVQKHFSSALGGDISVFLLIECPVATPIAPFEHSATSELEYEMLLGRDKTFEIMEFQEIFDAKKIESLAGRDNAPYIEKLMFYKLKIVL